MKHLYHIAFLIIFFNCALHAQNSFKPGYVVTAKGDTTRGLINYKQWRANPDQLVFKKNATTAEINYTKDNAPAFGVEGYGSYHLFSVRLRKYTPVPGDQIDFADTLYMVKNVYLSEIVLGKKASLYKYEDGGKIQLLIAEGSSVPKELIGYHQINFTNYSKIEAVDTYKKQLLELATVNQPGNYIITRKIEFAQYKAGDLDNIIIAINGNNDVKFVEKLRKKSRFFVGLALNANATKFTGEHHVYHSSGNVWSYSPQLNAGLDLFSDKDAKLMFRTELNLSAVHTEFSFTNTLFAGTPGVTTYTYKDKYNRVILSLNPQVVYNFYNTPKLKAFIAGGPKFDLTLHHSNKQSATSLGPGSISNIRPYNPVSVVYYNLTAKAGIKIQRFQLYGAYVTPFKLYDQGEAGAMVNTSYNFGINYFLGI